MAPPGRKRVNRYAAPAAEREQLRARMRSLATIPMESSSAAAEPKPKEPTEDQNEHLADYRAFIRFWKELTDDVTDDEVDVLGFTADLDTLYEQLAVFMGFLREMAPDASPEHDPITYSELCEYRVSMLYWVDRFFGGLHPGTAKPSRKDLGSQMERGMVSFVLKYLSCPVQSTMTNDLGGAIGQRRRCRH